MIAAGDWIVYGVLILAVLAIIGGVIQANNEINRTKYLKEMNDRQKRQEGR